MAKFGLLLIVIGVALLALPWFGFKLSFEDFLGTSRPWVFAVAIAFGLLLLYAGGRSGT